MTPESKEKSNWFAKKNGLQPYEFVLHPRTTGFTYLAQQMRKSKRDMLSAIFTFWREKESERGMRRERVVNIVILCPFRRPTGCCV